PSIDPQSSNVLAPMRCVHLCLFFFQAEDGIRDRNVTGVQTCALPIFQNTGKQYKIIATFDIVESINFPRYLAAITPSNVPTNIVTVSLRTTNIKVTCNFSNNTSVTGALYVYDVPRSPCIKLEK